MYACVLKVITNVVTQLRRLSIKPTRKQSQKFQNFRT